MDWDSTYIEALIALALAEDVGSGDVTTAATVSLAATASARIVAGQDLVCAGLPLIEKILSRLDAEISVELRAVEGQKVATGGSLAEINGSTSAILSGEKTVVNFLTHLCGIATRTREYVDQVSGIGARIRDSRNTAPGLRQLEHYAVRMGGGVNHRAGLFDAVVLSQAHIAAAGGVKAALDQAHSHVSRLMNPAPLTAYEATGAVPPENEAGSLSVQIAIRNEEELKEALSAGADSVLLEDLPPEKIRALVRVARSVRSDCMVEGTGDISPGRAREYAETGIDFLSPAGLIALAPRAAMRLLVESPQEK